MRRWLPILSAGLLGMAFSVWMNASGMPNPVLYARVSVSVLIFLLGVCLSTVAGAALLLYEWVERRQANQALTAAEERRRFLQRLDHELKNPITAILAGLANLSAADSTPSQGEVIASISSQVQRLRRLVADLRKLSDLETRPLECGPVEMDVLMEEAYALIRELPAAEERRMVLTIPRAPWPLPAVHGDHDLLFLAVYNLLDNALKFSGQGDTVELRAYEDGALVVVEVADTGPGIPDMDRPHVWEELYRGQTARRIEGSGLGLALVRAIAIRHEGSVDLRSREGQGTVFSLRIPVGEAGNPS